MYREISLVLTAVGSLWRACSWANIVIEWKYLSQQSLSAVNLETMCTQGYTLKNVFVALIFGNDKLKRHTCLNRRMDKYIAAYLYKGLLQEI